MSDMETRMAERKYTLREIDEMRSLIGAKLPAPLYEWSGPIGGTAKQTESSLRSISAFEAKVEALLRTAIMAGLGPEDFSVNG